MSQSTIETKIQKGINGVDVVRLKETCGAVTEQPSLAQFKFRASNQWQDGAHNRTRIDGYFGAHEEISHDRPYELDVDEPPALLGRGIAANPAEYLLTALSSCMTTSLVYHAAAKGIQVENVESDYEGDIDLRGFLNLDPNIRKGYEEIRVRFRVKSDADGEKLRELVKHSPIWDVVRNPTPVKVEFVTE